jgi:hypothetical protein
MKKIILMTAASVALSIASFAGEKNNDSKLLKDLTTTLGNSMLVHWTNKAEYTKATFSFNDKTAFAFYDPNDNTLIGFGIQSDKTDLPAIISDAIKSKYGDWAVVDAMTFIDTQGYINYFVQVGKNNKNLALKITPAGHVSIYGKIYNPVNE